MTRTIAWVPAVAVLSGLSVVQVAIFDQFWIGGRVRIDLLLLAVVSIGLRADARSAALLGFAAGLFVDLFRFGPFGLHALIFCLAAWTLANNDARMLQVGAGFRFAQGTFAVLLTVAATWTTAAVFGQRPPPFGNESLVAVGLSALVGAAVLPLVDRATATMLPARRTQAPRVPRADVVRAEP